MSERDNDPDETEGRALYRALAETRVQYDFAIVKRWVRLRKGKE